VGAAARPDFIAHARKPGASRAAEPGGHGEDSTSTTSTSEDTAPEGAAPTAAALAPELTPLLQSMARDLATVGQRVEQLKASQEQMARDNANLAEQLKAGREEMARVIAKVSEQNLRPKIPEPLPRPTATATRKPVSTLPSPRATAQPHAEKTQLSSAPRAPMPLR
jgi:hypothetical protein